MNILLLLMFMSSTSLADDSDAVTLQIGEKAPFTGTLLSPSAAARLLTDSDAELALCQAESRYLLDKQLSELQLKLNLEKTALAACQYRYDANVELYEQNIEYLQKQALTPSWEKSAWYVGGVLTGVVIFFGSTYALKKIGE